MQLIEIANRAITISLTPEDARRIGQACTVAADQDLPDEATAACFEMLAVAFDAMALGAVTHSYVAVDHEKCMTLSWQRAWMLRPLAERLKAKAALGD